MSCCSLAELVLLESKNLLTTVVILAFLSHMMHHFGRIECAGRGSNLSDKVLASRCDAQEVEELKTGIHRADV